jgi:hypothetical protein
MLCADRVIWQHPFHFIAAGTFGLAVNLLSTLIIQMAGATTVKLLAAGRGILVVVCGMLIFAEKVNGVGLILFALVLTCCIPCVYAGHTAAMVWISLGPAGVCGVLLVPLNLGQLCICGYVLLKHEEKQCARKTVCVLQYVMVKPAQEVAVKHLV